MAIGQCTLEDVADCTGTVVIIDVLRAFTTAAVGLAGGVASWEVVGDTATARARREVDPASVLLGEDDLTTPEDFALGNSPVLLAAALARGEVAGQPVVQRTTAGTRGVVTAARADRVLATSFAVAGATAAAVAGDDRVWFCVTGAHSGRDGDEDRACADYLAALLASDGPVDPAPFVTRVARSDAADLFDRDLPELPIEDVAFCQVVDRHDFAMEVVRRGDRFLLDPVVP